MSDCVTTETSSLQPLLTVVVPVYNVSPYLERTLQSVVDAVVEWSKSEVRSHFDFATVEVICVDDGSTDRSGELADKFASEHSDCEGLVWQVIHQANAGVSAARNAALDVATGEWVMMLDGDDTWSSDLLVKLFDAVKHYPACDAVCFGNVKVDEHGNECGSIGAPDVAAAVMSGDEILMDGRGPYSKFCWCVWDKMYRRTDFAVRLWMHAIYQKRRCSRSCEGGKRSSCWIGDGN